LVKTAIRNLLLRAARPFWDVYRREMITLIDEKFDAWEERSIINLPKKSPQQRFKRLQIGITDDCNLVCGHCFRTSVKQQGFGTLPLRDFGRFLSAFSPDWFDILVVSSAGEVTLVPDLLDYLYLAKRLGWNDVCFYTNATSRNEELVEEIIVQNLLGMLGISVEAADPKLYQHIRHNKYENFERFLSNVVRLRAKYSSPMRLAFAVTCMKENLEDLPNIVKLAGEANADEIIFVHIDPQFESQSHKRQGKLCVPEQHIRNLGREKVLRVFQEVLDMARGHDLGVALPEPYPEITGYDLSSHNVVDGEKFRCTLPFRYVQVDFDGDVFPCCRHKRRDYFGNIMKLDFASIHGNLKYKQLIDSLREGATPLDMCRGCGCLLGENLSL